MSCTAIAKLACVLPPYMAPGFELACYQRGVLPHKTLIAEIQQQKLLAHLFEFKLTNQIQRYTYALSGSSSQLMQGFFQKLQLQSHVRTPYPVSESGLQAIGKLPLLDLEREIPQQVDQEPLAITVPLKKHSILLYVLPSSMDNSGTILLGNRGSLPPGQTLQSQSGIVVFKFHNLQSIWPALRQLLICATQMSVAVFYRVLEKNWHAQAIPLAEIPLPKQTAPVCAWNALEMAVYVQLAVTSYQSVNTVPTTWSTTFQQVATDYQNYLRNLKLAHLNTYLQETAQVKAYDLHIARIRVLQAIKLQQQFNPDYAWLRSKNLLHVFWQQANICMTPDIIDTLLTRYHFSGGSQTLSCISIWYYKLANWLRRSNPFHGKIFQMKSLIGLTLSWRVAKTLQTFTHFNTSRTL